MLTPTPQKATVCVHFVRNGPAYLPELDAYVAFITSHGHQALVHEDSTSVPSNAQVVWWMCGRVSSTQARRLKNAFHIHEYASASVPPHARLKDWVKHWTQPKPDYRIFQNGWVRDRMGFNDGVPHTLRDMGVAQAFFDAAAPALPVASYEDDAPARIPPNTFDLVYLGEMTRLLPFLPLLQAIRAAGRSLLLIGEVPDALREQLPASVTCTGRVPHADVPMQLRRARFGLNLVSNIAPYNQQTSTKLLEYCAVGLPVVSNDYAWVRYFAAHYQGNLHLLRDAPSTWPHSLGQALDAYPYLVPDVRALVWPQLLRALPLWKHLHIVPEVYAQAPTLGGVR
ncbi:glycosyltransferase [Limnohabitans sp.]|uniref:glycosyltransferase family protein n=1 Tax=Limnohabitans sp. TaxID=1907725 RepID=UPI00286F7CF2|nr:glycosyltransferase [Limnohabitans sp.]